MIELETVAKVAAWIQHGLLAARVVVKVMLLDNPVPAIHDSRRYHNGRNYAGKKAQQHLGDSSSILAFCRTMLTLALGTQHSNSHDKFDPREIDEGN